MLISQLNKLIAEQNRPKERRRVRLRQELDRPPPHGAPVRRPSQDEGSRRLLRGLVARQRLALPRVDPRGRTRDQLLCGQMGALDVGQVTVNIVLFSSAFNNYLLNVWHCPL